MIGTYKAPDHLPSPDPVVVKLAVRYYSKKKKKMVWGSCKCQLVVYDAYNVQIIQEFTARKEMGSRLIDSASFSVWLYPEKVYIDDIKNYEPKVLEEGKRGGIAEKITTEGSAGSINISQGYIKTDSITHDDPPIVYIEFIPVEVIWYKFRYVSKVTATDLEPLVSETVPGYIAFLANGQAQTKSFPHSAGAYKVIVTPRRR
jgi:hypothetical protein